MFLSETKNGHYKLYHLFLQLKEGAFIRITEQICETKTC